MTLRAKGGDADALLIAVHKAAASADPARGGPLRCELVALSGAVTSTRYRFTLYSHSDRTQGLDMPVFSSTAETVAELSRVFKSAWRALADWGLLT